MAAGDQDRWATGAERDAFCAQGSLVSGAKACTRNITKPLNAAPEVHLYNREHATQLRARTQPTFKSSPRLHHPS
jgi:hypothetical protein